jgi:hypothetical protein
MTMPARIWLACIFAMGANSSAYLIDGEAHTRADNPRQVFRCSNEKHLADDGVVSGFFTAATKSRKIMRLAS